MNFPLFLFHFETEEKKNETKKNEIQRNLNFILNETCLSIKGLKRTDCPSFLPVHPAVGSERTGARTKIILRALNGRVGRRLNFEGSERMGGRAKINGRMNMEYFHELYTVVII